MKPKDLKFPITTEPYIQDSILYLPRASKESTLFLPKAERTYIEFCSGNGDWLVAQAQKHPNINWVAVELQFDRVRKIWSKMKNGPLNNIFIVAGEAYQFAKNHILPESIDKIFINFPDPWPKRRHEKNRLMQEPFLEELKRILKPQGEVTFVTDDRPYLEWTIKRFQKNSAFACLHPEPFYRVNDHQYGSSYFNDLWVAQGKTIHFFEVRKK